MYDWHRFENVFVGKTTISPDPKQVEAANRHRKELGGHLFFDKMWTSMGLKQPSKYYPPKSNQELRSLWSRIVEASTADEQKLALLFYLLRDYRVHPIEETFVRKSRLPERYQLLVAGLWELDHCQFSRALEHLTDPSLTPTFADDILLALLQHPKCDSSLAMAYYITVKPPLRDSSVLQAYFSLLLQTNIAEAYYFAQSHTKHKQLFEELIVFVHNDQAGEHRSDKAVQLISLPFTQQEESWFEECLLHGTAAKTRDAKDTLIMWYITTGRTNHAPGTLDRVKGPKLNGVNWDDIRNVIPA